VTFAADEDVEHRKTFDLFLFLLSPSAAGFVVLHKGAIASSLLVRLDSHGVSIGAFEHDSPSICAAQSSVRFEWAAVDSWSPPLQHLEATSLVEACAWDEGRVTLVAIS
jgi:hypothetical protein